MDGRCYPLEEHLFCLSCCTRRLEESLRPTSVSSGVGVLAQESTATVAASVPTVAAEDKATAAEGQEKDEDDEVEACEPAGDAAATTVGDEFLDSGSCSVDSGRGDSATSDLAYGSDTESVSSVVAAAFSVDRDDRSDLSASAEPSISDPPATTASGPTIDRTESAAAAARRRKTGSDVIVITTLMPTTTTADRQTSMKPVKRYVTVRGLAITRI